MEVLKPMRFYGDFERLFLGFKKNLGEHVPQRWFSGGNYNPR